ncbi:MAG: DUF5667 domain-containing protein [Phycisphaerae bacterium]|nr:DUF5667 domain-containing protein [Phycisphaerae bacterium]
MDDFIVKQLKTLGKIRPSASWLSSQRSFLISEISRNKEPMSSFVPVFNFFNLNFKKHFRPVFAIAMVLIVLVSCFGTIGIIGAAQNSLPGDPLYGLKTFFEQTQLTFASTDEGRVKLSIKFTNQRMDEFTQVADNPGKISTVEKSVKNLTEQLVAVQENMDKLKEKNSQKAAEVAQMVNNQVVNYEETLIRTSEQLAYVMPSEKDKIKADIDQALIEVNKTKEKADEMIESEKRTDVVPSNIIVPAEEEQTESESIPFEKLNEE